MRFLLAVGAALALAAPASGETISDLQLVATAPDSVTILAPKNLPVRLWIMQDANQVAFIPEAINSTGHAFVAGAVAAPCEWGFFYEWGASCPKSIRHVRLVLGDESDYVNASIVLTQDFDRDAYWVSVFSFYFGRTCSVTTDDPGVLDITVAGGGGDDTIIGSPRSDTIDGGTGRDTIAPGAGDDDLHGGTGLDRVSFCEATAPIAASLDEQANDGAPGQHSNIHDDVEDLEGGDGNDRLTGNGAPNRLIGGPGDDVLDGGAGADDLRGGDGNDQLLARDGALETVDCGEGAADAATIDAGESTIACETVDQAPSLIRDADGDGSPKPIDCDDTDRTVHPGAREILDDGIDQDCSAGDAVDPDRDRDGVPRPIDCDDTRGDVSPQRTELPGNAIDEDCDGIAQPYARIPTLVADSFAASRGSTRVERLLLLDVRAGTSIALTCSGHGCPRRRWTQRSTRASDKLDLRRAAGLAGARLRPGAKLELRITAPDTLGKRVLYRVRANRIPSVTSGCLQPGSSRSTRCPT